MRAIVQRVSQASVTTDEGYQAAINGGVLVYLGVANEDTVDDAAALAEKVRYLRIFEDDSGKMNRDLAEIGGSALVISAFSLLGDARKGRRPSYVNAAPHEKANELYGRFCDILAAFGVPVSRGVFRAHMQVTSTNNGPICILLDSTKTF